MLNGWTEEEIERLVRRTAAPRKRVEEFCRAVDKQLYLMLDERQRRATLHFHLRSDGACERVEDRSSPEGTHG